MEHINIFDFDGTLTNDTWPKFWVWIKNFNIDGKFYTAYKRNKYLDEAIEKFQNENKGDNLENFFEFFNRVLSTNQVTIEDMMEGEKYIEYNKGVIEFLRYYHSKNYIVSGGIKTFLENLIIARYFDGIYGTTIDMEENKILRINKVMKDEDKIEAIKDILRKNGRKDDDCTNVTYVGDGCSDEPSMKYVHDHGGISIFIHQKCENKLIRNKTKEIFNRLKENGSIDVECLADYSKGGELIKYLK